jgi:hypothetical protein
MTSKQRIYYVWLVLENAFKIMSKANTTSDGKRLIDKAYAKRKQLGIPFVEGMDHAERKRGIRRMIGSLVRNEDVDYGMEDPF